MREGAIDVPRGADMFPKTVVAAALCASYGGQAPIIVPAARRSIHQSANSKTLVFRLLCGRELAHKTTEYRDAQQALLSILG